MSYAHGKDVKAGTILIPDGGFTCMEKGVPVTVQADSQGDLFVPCKAGSHYIDGQLDERGLYIGLSLKGDV